MNNITKEIWNKLAPWWDEAYDEGDIFHRAFLFPTFTTWVSVKPGIQILDIGCGNSALARIFAAQGANVVAVDFSEVFIEKAKKRSAEHQIEYHVVDATDEVQLKTLLGHHHFDYITCSMVLHDIPIITPLANALPKLLKPTGKFIFAVPHPCFNSGLVKLDELKSYMSKKQLILSDRYIKSEKFEILSKPDQPIPQISFHRPITQLFNEFLNIGMVMTDFIEPVAGTIALPENFLWGELKEIPPALISQWEIKHPLK